MGFLRLYCERRVESWQESTGGMKRSGIGKGPRGGIRIRVAADTVALYNQYSSISVIYL